VIREHPGVVDVATGSKAPRGVAKVEFHSGELFPRVGFIVTNLETDSRAVVGFYNKRAPQSNGSRKVNRR